MKKQILIIILLLLNSLIVFIPVDIVRGDPDPSGGTIVGDTVYWENSYANLSVYPHTSTNIIRQKQYANLTWKESDNVIDVAFRFDDALSYGRIWRWNGADWTQITMEHITYNNKHYYYYDEFNVVQDTTYHFKWEYDVIANTSGKWDLFAKLDQHTVQQALDNNWYVALDPWWNASYDFYESIYINPSFVSADLNNFPLLVNISISITENCSTDGSDIRFISSDNTTEFAYHFAETWNPVTSNLVWVNVTNINSTHSTVIHCYYGNSLATDNQTPSNVWSNGYAGVYYLNETSGTTVVDYSGNGYDATYVGDLPTGNGTRVGVCQYFDGVDDYISLPQEIHDAIAGQDGGYYGQFFHEDDSIDTFWFTDYSSATNYTRFKYVGATNKWRLIGHFNNSDAWIPIDYGTSVNIDTAWIAISAHWDSVSVKMFGEHPIDTFNLQQQAITQAERLDEAFDKFYVGISATLTNDFKGYVDEIRIYDEYKNSSWRALEYDSMNQSNGLLSWQNYSTGVSTNTTTNITSINATIHGWITELDLLDGSYSCGFWYGTGFPLMEGTFDANATIGSYTSNTEFDYNASSLTDATTYYVAAWISNASYWGVGETRTFATLPLTPTGFTLTHDSVNDGVDIVWTYTGTTVVVRQNDTYPNSWVNGTIVYNGTGNSYDDDASNVPGTHWFYRAWGYTNPFSSDYVEANISVPPAPPTDVDTNVLANNTFDIVWTIGLGANTTVVRRSLGGYPSGVTDGTQLYNDTGTRVNIQDVNEYFYYSLWSYGNLTYSSQVNITVGGLVIGCFNEETNGSLWFDVFISNQDGSRSYESRNNTNFLVLNISQLPTGDDIKITVSAASNYSEKSEVSYWSINENYTITYIVLSQTADSKSSMNVTCINEGDDAHSYPPFTLDADLVTILPDDADNFTKIFVNYTHEEYSSRLYYRDIDESSFSFLNAYLPPTENKELYLLEVIDEAANKVQDAHIEVKRSVNGTYVVISRLLTDANGQADLNLISDRDYIFIISKDGYVTENASWTPGTSIFTHTFKIVTEIIPIEPDTFGDIIDFYGTLFVNNTMRVTFYDLDVVTLNTHFIIYENYNGTLTYMGEYNGTTSNDIIFWINVSNATRLHTIVLFMNHSTLGEIVDYRISVFPVHIDRDGGTWLENLIVSVVGEWDYGYAITFIWVFPCVLLIAGLASIGHPGTGILGAGLYSAWLTWNITLPEEAKILTFASIAIVTGFITLFLVKGKKVIHS